MELQGNVQGLIKLLGGGSEVTVTPVLLEGVEIMRITVDQTEYLIYAPEGGGSEVSVSPILASGTKIATFIVDDTSYDIYAPSPTEVSVSPIISAGTKIATIQVNSQPFDIYAPTPESVSVTQILDQGTKIATITVGATSTDLFAPAGGGGGSFSVTPLSAVGAQDISTLTLNDSILNYDIIVVECCRDTQAAQRGNTWIPTAIIDQASSYRRYRAICPAGSQNVDGCLDFYFQNNNQIVKSYNNAAFFYACYGIKF